ncbi:MAG: RNA repair transcriptional activator RtcR family protein [Bacillota bacterium]
MPLETAPTKVLLSMVGNRDPYAACTQTGSLSEGSILTLCRHIQPDIVFLFPSAAQLAEKTSNTQVNAEKTREALLVLWPDIKVLLYPLGLPDPTDYRQVLHLMEQMVGSVRQQAQKELGLKVEYHINISSGTPQMQACWLLLVNGGRLKAKVWQVIAPQWQKGPEARCRVVETEFVEEQNKISRVQNFFANYYFKAAQDELELLALSTYLPQRAFLAEEMAKVCEAYHHWDLFQHEKAQSLLTDVSKNLSRFPDMSQLNNKFKAQIETLQLIISSRDKESEINLLDLFHNAQRRRSAQQYVDCLARFKRLYEGCQNFFIRSELQIDPTPKYRNQPHWVKEIVQKQPDAYLVLSDWERILMAKKKRFPVSEHLANEIREYNEKRNKSIVGHGMGSVREEDAQLAMKLARKILQGFFGHLELDTYSFGEAELNKIKNLIFKAI